MSKAVLEKFCSQSVESLPVEYRDLGISDFGIEINLYDYQKKAIVNLLNCLNIFYANKNPDKDSLYNKYCINGLDEDLQEKLNINSNDDNFDFLINYYDDTASTIEFKKIINRASFWMATGLFVAGVTAGLDIIKKYPNCEALWVRADGKTFMSKGFPIYLRKERR